MADDSDDEGEGSVAYSSWSGAEFESWSSDRGSIESVTVTTTMIVAPHDVRDVKYALYNGVPENGMLPLPMHVVKNILQKAQLHCIVEKKADVGFVLHQTEHCLFRFGPLPVKPFKVAIDVVSGDQGWSDYPWLHKYNKDGWTWGEVDILDVEGNSKLDRRVRVLTHVHATSYWTRLRLKFKNNKTVMSSLEAGDTLEMYFRSVSNDWAIDVTEAKMTVHYQPP